MNLTLHVWRQAARSDNGAFKTYKAENISPDASFLEMLDVVNEGLIANGDGRVGRAELRVQRRDCRLEVLRQLGELGVERPLRLEAGRAADSRRI